MQRPAVPLESRAQRTWCRSSLGGLHKRSPGVHVPPDDSPTGVPMKNREPQGEPLTDAGLTSLEQLLSGASPGPWDAVDQGGGFNTGVIRRNREDLLGRMDSLRDAALCAALRNLAPALLEEIRSSRAWRKEAEALLWDIGVRTQSMCDYACDSRKHFHAQTCLRGRINAMFSGDREGNAPR